MSVFWDLIEHEQLDRSAEGQAAIATIAEAMPLHDGDARDNKWLEERVNSGISFGGLRLELLAVARHWGLPDTWFASWDRWQRFGSTLAFEMSGRQVSMGARSAAAARRRMAETILDLDTIPRG